VEYLFLKWADFVRQLDLNRLKCDPQGKDEIQAMARCSAQFAE
jgi:hypothetical protein